MKNINKKFMSFVLMIALIVCTLINSGCNNNTLLLLNWGEYINEDVVAKFEEKYDCTVNISIAENNELFYAKITSGTTAYDLVVPSDYTVERMVNSDLLQKIDTSRLENYNKDNFLPGVIGILNEMNKTSDSVDYYDYAMPYLWGTFGFMYNKNVPGLEEAVLKHGVKAYFDKSLLPNPDVKVGMYNVPLFSYAVASFYNNTYGPTIESPEAFNEVKKVLSMRRFNEWGTDTLKKGIAAGNLDLAYCYTGDCLDVLYEQFADGKTPEEVMFDIYIPDNTIAFLDCLVMPKNARHTDLAYKFIDFFYETENCKANASVVGYCTPLRSSYDAIVTSTDPEDKDWAYAVSKYYPLPKEGEKSYKGIPLTIFSKPYLTKLTNLINDIKLNTKAS